MSTTEITVAEAIKNTARNASEAFEMSRAVIRKPHSIDQEWEDERTVITFSDGSVLTLCGSEFWVGA